MPDREAMFEEDENPISLTPPAEKPKSPEELEAKIAELESRLARLQPPKAAEDLLPDDPDAMVEVEIPPGPTGHPIQINGEAFVGRKTLKRSTLTMVLAMLSAKVRSEQDRLNLNEGVNRSILEKGKQVYVV